MLRALAERVVLWDFDGTLAWRPGLWSACVLEILDEHEPGHEATVERLRSELKGNFPWHRHDEPHPELCDADRWWAALAPLLQRSMRACGVDAERARRLASEVRLRFTDAGRGWRVFPDSCAALERAGAAGWRNVILSNHVPELESLVRDLGLGAHVERVFSSACTGYEKPHPQAFRQALAACGGARSCWMVGDNPVADVAGAEALGIPAILVRGVSDVPTRRAPDALGALELILADGAARAP